MNYLDIKIDANITVKEAGGAAFIQWVLKEVSKANLVNSNEAVELNALANFYPGATMSDDEKIKIIEKMVKAGIKFS